MGKGWSITESDGLEKFYTPKRYAKKQSCSVRKSVYGNIYRLEPFDKADAQPETLDKNLCMLDK